MTTKKKISKKQQAIRNRLSYLRNRESRIEKVRKYNKEHAEEKKKYRKKYYERTGK